MEREISDPMMRDIINEAKDFYRRVFDITLSDDEVKAEIHDDGITIDLMVDEEDE